MRWTDIRHFSKFFEGIFIPLQHRDDFFERLCGFRSPLVLSHPLGEEADDPELILGQGDHAGRILVMGLPVDVFQKLEDPPKGWAVRHPSQLVGKSLFEGGESLPETFLGQGIDQESHRHDGDEFHDPGLLLELTFLKSKFASGIFEGQDFSIRL